MTAPKIEIQPDPDPDASLLAAGVTPQRGMDYRWVGARKLKRIAKTPEWTPVLLNGEPVRRDNRASFADKAKSDPTYDYLYARRSTGRYFNPSDSAAANAIGALMQDAADQKWDNATWLSRITAADGNLTNLRTLLDERAAEMEFCKEVGVKFHEWTPGQWLQRVKNIGYAS